MIDIKELRIGNTVLVEGESVKVESVGDNPISGLNIIASPHDKMRLFESKDIDPIPITESLLRKLGFQEEENNLHYEYAIRYDNPERLCLFIILIKEGLIRIEAWDDYRHIGNMLCSFLHELETFVYLTTKKELEYDTSNEC